MHLSSGTTGHSVMGENRVFGGSSLIQKTRRFGGSAVLVIGSCWMIGNVSAAVQLRYLPNKETVKEIILENEEIRYAISLDNTVKLSSALMKATNIDLLQGNSPLTFSSVRMSLPLDDVGYHLFTVRESTSPNAVEISIRQQSSYVENSAVVIQVFSLGTGLELHWRARVVNTATGGRSHRVPRTRTAEITFPLMQQLRIGEESAMHSLIPTQGSFFCIDDADDFVFYFTGRHDPKMPIDIYNVRENTGVYFHVLETAFDWNFTDKADFAARVFQLTQKAGEETVIMDCRIAPHQGDWHAGFETFKDHVRSNFDFTYYKRPVQEKYRQRLVSHLTFLYGHDIYDPETNEFQTDRFLDEGELNFGGYDYMLLWHDYPRMGIDDRDQFAIYQDLPGGLEGLRELVDKAHARGVHVFVPYKPWDIMRGRKDHFTQEARISKAIGADGVFLDTMNDSDIAFREALDAVNPDNVFVSEGRPNLAAAQLITGSWSQYPAANKMPNVDLFRFVLPEHNVHNSNRVARKRDELVYNALFNGIGLLVWEDIFGEINKFTWNERILIHRYNRIIHENQDAFLTDNPIPLVADLRADLYVNAFPIVDKCVYPAYQLGREKVDRKLDNRLIGPFLEVDHPANWHYLDIWNHQVIPTEKKDGKTRLIFREEPIDIMSCVIGLPENLRVERREDVLSVSVTRPLENSSVHINRVDNLTMMEREVSKLPGSGGKVDVGQMDLKFPYLVVVKLMQGEILKDEVIIDLGWKKF